MFYPTLNQVLTFLKHLFDGGLGYSALNTARSALSSLITIDNTPLGQHRLVIRFLKSVFEQRPALPRNLVIWDADRVLEYLRSLSPVKRLPLKQLTLKLTMLLLLLSGQRQQSIQYLDVRFMTLTFSRVTFQIQKKVKQTRPGFHIPEIVFRGYAPDRRLCVITVLKAYLERTLVVRGKEKQLLLTYGRPVHAASRASIRRWATEILVAAGIDMTVFTAHSTRSASTSKAAASVPLTTILRTAGWSNQNTFRNYYELPVDKSGSFEQAVLAGTNKQSGKKRKSKH